MDVKTILQQLPTILSGIGITVQLMILALAIGLFLALVLTMVSYLRFGLLKRLVYAYTFIIRGSPLLVQIFIIYYGSSQFDYIRDSWLWSILKQPFWCAVIALSVNSSGYCINLFRGVIDSIPRGEFEACRALGMSPLQMSFKVIFGRFSRMVLPAYSNEVIIILKSTSLASTITIMDLMGVSHNLISQTYATLPYLLVAGISYLLLNTIIIRVFNIIEKSVSIPQ